MTALLVSLVCGVAAFAPAPDWKSELARKLPLMGHRNWLVVADSAYPEQTSPGIETIVTHADHLTVLREALADLAKCKHIHPIPYLDKELSYVPEARAPGVTVYRDTLAQLLKGQPVQVLPHGDIIAKLDDAGKTFSVLILKTDETIAYTSVFMFLDCAYWGPDAEKELREKMAGS